MPTCTRTGPQIGSLTRKKRRQAQAPSQQPPHAPTPIRRLPPIDRWAPQAAHSTSRPGQSAYANPPLPAPLPEPPQPNRRDISRASHRLQSRRLSVSLRAPLQRRLLSRPNRRSRLLLLADLDDRVSRPRSRPGYGASVADCFTCTCRITELYATTRPAQSEPASTVRARTLLGVAIQRRQPLWRRCWFTAASYGDRRRQPRGGYPYACTWCTYTWRWRLCRASEQICAASQKYRRILGARGALRR